MIAFAGLVGLAIGLWAAAFMLRRGAVDLPDERRLHTTPTPRGGGLGLPLAGLAALPLGLVGDHRLLFLTVGWAVPNGLIGFIDDYRPLRSRVKFALQAGLAIAVCALGLRLDVLDIPPFPPLALGWLAWPLSVLWLVWNANVYNFMDGMDGLTAGTGLLFFFGFGVWSIGAGLVGLAIFCAVTAGALVGFLRYNLPPAKIFMGDAGSLFVGGALGALSLGLGKEAAVPVAASTLLMGTFVWDATYTIVRRALRGDPMLPHRSHLYQRLALAGWSHGRVRTLYLGVAILFAAAALAIPVVPRPLAGGLVLGAVLLCLFMVRLVQRAERRP